MRLVHLPGRGKRFGEQPFTRLKLLVDTIADRIRGAVGHPFALYGHSMGAIITFELARELRRRYRVEPVGLFISGSRAPHAARSEEPFFDLPDAEFIAKILELNGTPREVLDSPDTRELFLPLLRADFEIMDTYIYKPESPLSCPITVYGGLQDQEVPVTDLRQWQEYTSGLFKMRLFPGDHFFIHVSSAEFAQFFGRDLSASLRNLARFAQTSEHF